ncbi:hypothetical protein CPB86DRAFT_819632 [Serendipita vermifera]|nr:hypothetical protein CPB86DRAFT_819632 [Serendipita vermifera]
MADSWTRVAAQNGTPAHQLFTKKLEKPDLDDRDYRLIKLDNGLHALLIHDPTTDKAAAAMDVCVGNMSDPNDMPGLAHFCEHLLFMGTKAFPSENEYSLYIKSNGGSTNAYTSTSNTCYYFSIGHGCLSGAIDRFSGFFHSPLFDPSCTIRELNAVNSEHKKNAQSDVFRLWQTFKSQSLPGHSWSKFGTGSWETLTEAARSLEKANQVPPDDKEGGFVARETRRRLIEWWEKHYCASIMNLVILGRESLDDLTKMALDKFSAIPNRGLTMPVETIPWGPEQQGKILFAKTVMDYDTLEISFPLERQDVLYESKPATFISHFIGHEGAGSILSYLKAKGWVTQLWSGPQSSARGFNFFKINVKLTKKGLVNYKSVLEAIYAYLTLLRATTLPEWSFEELRSLQSIGFRFQQKANPESYVSRVAELLSRPWAKERTLSGSRVIWKSDFTLVRNMLHRELLPEAGSIMITAKDFSPIGLDGPWQHEKWYGTEYIIREIETDILAKAQTPNTINELFFPGPNEFIPTNLDVERIEVSQPAKSPALIRKTETSSLWYKKDDQFWLPKGYIGVFVRSPIAFAAPKHVVMTKFVECLVTDALTEYSYDASLADLDYSIVFDDDGNLLLQTGGYTDKMAVLLRQLLEKTKHHVVQPDRFLVYKEELRQSFENTKKKEPHLLVHDWMNYALRNISWTVDEMLNEIDHITVEQVQQHITELFTRAQTTLLVNGNFYPKTALEAQDMVEEILDSRTILPDEVVSRTVLLPVGKNFVHHRTLDNPKETNNGLEYYLQVADHTDDLKSKLLLLEHLLHEPIFNVLRTKEQLGYVVQSYPWIQVATSGLVFRIQSEKSAVYVENRVETFLANYKTQLQQMDQTDFEKQRAGIIVKLRQKLDNLDQESSRFAFRIMDGTYDFTTREKQANLIEQFSLQDVVGFFEKYIDPSSPSRAKLSIHMNSQVKPGSIANFSVAASKVYLEDLKAAQVPVDEAQYHALSKAEPSVDAVIGFWEPYLTKLPHVTQEKREQLLQRVKHLAAEHPAAQTDTTSDRLREDTIVVDDLAVFKKGLPLSKPATPVIPLEVTPIPLDNTPSKL